MDGKNGVRWFGIVIGAAALLVGLVLSGVTLFLIVPFAVLAVPVFYLTWRVRKQRLLREEDRNERELGVRQTYDHALVETVPARAPPPPASAVEGRQTFDNAQKV
jgi:membrane protein implicated in regulation of membrane protease activity